MATSKINRDKRFVVTSKLFLSNNNQPLRALKSDFEVLKNEKLIIF
jgi:hypothetical protein